MTYLYLETSAYMYKQIIIIVCRLQVMIAMITDIELKNAVLKKIIQL